MLRCDCKRFTIDNERAEYYERYRKVVHTLLRCYKETRRK